MTTTYNVMQAARQWKRDSAEGRLINDLADLFERLKAETSHLIGDQAFMEAKITAFCARLDRINNLTRPHLGDSLNKRMREIEELSGGFAKVPINPQECTCYNAGETMTNPCNHRGFEAVTLRMQREAQGIPDPCPWCEIERLREEGQRDYADTLKFQAKFIAADQELRALKASMPDPMVEQLRSQVARLAQEVETLQERT